MPNMRALKAAYYVAAIAFHLVLFFTNTGNYFHGGTPLQLVALQGGAVLIAAAAIKLLPRVGIAEKIIVVLFGLVPIIFVIGSLVSLIGR